MAAFPFFILVAGLVALVFGAELLVRSASRLAKAAGISTFVVGLTVVAFGTSAPELGSSVRAAFNGNGGLAVGAIVGSNIANISLILGLTAIICPIPVRLNVVRREVIQMIGVTILAMLLMLGDSIPRLGGLALIAGLAAFLVRSYIGGKRDLEQSEEMKRVAAELSVEVSAGTRPPVFFDIILLVVGIGLLVVGSDLLVSGATSIAKMFSVSDAVIGLTLVAFGTSVPELSLSIVAALKREPDIAIGNILGSNIFNILCVLGITSTITPTPLLVPDGMWQRDLWVMLGVSLACLPIFLTWGKVSRSEGVLLLGLYIGYMVVSFAG